MLKNLLIGLVLMLCASTAKADEVVLDFVNTATQAQISDFQSKYGIVSTYNSVFSEHTEQFQIVKNLTSTQATDLILKVSKDPLIENAELNMLYTIPEDNNLESILPTEEPSVTKPNDPMYKFQWHMNNIRMPEAWDVTLGKGAIVAVIDTGVAYEDYDDKQKNIKFKKIDDLKDTCFVPGYNFVDDTTHANDDHAHGSHCAGTIAQSTNNKIGVTGVAPKACIMPIKVLAAQGGGTSADVAEGIIFAADNGANIISMSLGSSQPSDIIEQAVKYALSKNVTIIAAAGNNGRGQVGFPAAFKGVIAVSATNLNNEITFYSQYGKEIGIAAPGGDTREDKNKDGVPDGVVQNTIYLDRNSGKSDPSRNGYYPFMGTSMATPHVAGVAALVYSMGIKKNTEVERILKQSANRKIAEDHGAPKGVEWDEKYGYGFLDAKAAVDMAKKSKNQDSAGIVDTFTSTSVNILNTGKEFVFQILWALMLSALVPFLAFGLLYGTKYKRPIGFASYFFGGSLIILGLGGFSFVVLGMVLGPAWLFINAIFSIGFGYLCTRD